MHCGGILCTLGGPGNPNDIGKKGGGQGVSKGGNPSFRRRETPGDIRNLAIWTAAFPPRKRQEIWHFAPSVVLGGHLLIENTPRVFGPTDQENNVSCLEKTRVFFSDHVYMCWNGVPWHATISAYDSCWFNRQGIFVGMTILNQASDSISLSFKGCSMATYQNRVVRKHDVFGDQFGFLHSASFPWSTYEERQGETRGD